jgi:hypothetical protein
LFFVAAPALSLNKENSFWVFIPVIILVCFIMMGKGGGCCGNHEDKKSDPAKKDGEKKAGRSLG